LGKKIEDALEVRRGGAIKRGQVPRSVKGKRRGMGPILKKRIRLKELDD